MTDNLLKAIEDDDDEDEDSDMPPPLDEAEQQKLLEIQRTLSYKKPQKKDKIQKDNNTQKKQEKTATSKFNDNVPLIGGYLAGEELFERQADAAGFEEEVVFITQ